MSDLFGNHIVGFPTRRLNYVPFNMKIKHEKLIKLYSMYENDNAYNFTRNIYFGLNTVILNTILF